MRRYLSLACLLIAWLCANGAVLDIEQVVAWGRMVAVYSRVLPLPEAMRETFDGSHPCALCRAVARARAADHQPSRAPAPSTVKLTLFCQEAEPFVPPVRSVREDEGTPVPRLSRRDPVPVPPPRRVGLSAG